MPLSCRRDVQVHQSAKTYLMANRLCTPSSNIDENFSSFAVCFASQLLDIKGWYFLPHTPQLVLIFLSRAPHLLLSPYLYIYKVYVSKCVSCLWSFKFFCKLPSLPHWLTSWHEDAEENGISTHLFCCHFMWKIFSCHSWSQPVNYHMWHNSELELESDVKVSSQIQWSL